jgi:flotillin
MRKGAEADGDRVRITAEAKAQAASQEAQALIALAEATRKRGEAEADAKRKLVEAENTVATKFLLRDVALKALEVLPDVTRELMTPARAISEIKVLQLQGMGGSVGANGESGGSAPFGGVASPVLKTILEAGAAYPLLREMLAFSQVDERGLADKARSFLGTLPAELRAVIDKDPELAKKLEHIGVAAPSGAGIQVHEIDPDTIPPAAPLPAE